MRLIDADALLERMKKDPLFPLVERYGVSGVIDAEPTVDAVEVVRCEDCRHWVGKHRSQCPVKCKTFGYCDLWEQYVGNGEKFFCAYGERREDGRSN